MPFFTSPDQISRSDRLRNRAEMRDSLPAISLLLAGQGALIALDNDDGASRGNVFWSATSAAGIILLAWAQLRSLRRADERQRIAKLEAMAVGFAAVMVLAFGAGLAEAMGIGDPRQSLQVISIAGVLAWVAALGTKTAPAG